MRLTLRSFAAIATAVLVAWAVRAWAQADTTKAPPPAEATFIGSNQCKICHPREHKSWATTKHAATLPLLASADAKTAGAIATKLKIKLTGSPLSTDACVTCHVTGFHQAGGFPQADSTTNAGVSHVGCESCHGPGSLHLVAASEQKKATIRRAVGADVCLTCHVPAMSPGFKYEEAKLTGVHSIRPRG